MSFWQFARVKAVDREIMVQLSSENRLFQSLKVWNTASRATSTSMNNIVEKDMLLHSSVNIRDNGYQCVQYWLREKVLMPGPPACTILLLENKYIPELLVFAPTRSLHTEVRIVNPGHGPGPGVNVANVDLVGTVPVMCTVIACEASFELNVDIKKSARFLRDLVLHHLRISPWCFSQPELGTNVVIDIFQPDGSQLDRGDVRTLKAILDVAGPVFHGIVDGHAGEADPDSPWQFVG